MSCLVLSAIRQPVVRRTARGPLPSCVRPSPACDVMIITGGDTPAPGWSITE
jgi:hypothetical protein